MLTFFTTIDYIGVLRLLIDFTVLATLIYWLLYFLRGTKSATILIGVICLFCVIGILADWLQLQVLRYLLARIWTILGVAIVVIFQPELRRAFAQAGSLFMRNETSSQMIDEVVLAAIQMSETKTGAIIVFEQNIGLAGIVNSSVALDAKVNSLLLQTIFFKNSPLHDCAVIIRKNKIVAAHAVLPLMQEEDTSTMRRLGTRHRAAVGITEETDAIALVVSEENGKISIANKGRIVFGFSADELSSQLKMLLFEDSKSEKTFFFDKFFARILPGRKRNAAQQKQQNTQDDLFSYQNKPEAK